MFVPLEGGQGGGPFDCGFQMADFGLLIGNQAIQKFHSPLHNSHKTPHPWIELQQLGSAWLIQNRQGSGERISI